MRASVGEGRGVFVSLGVAESETVGLATIVGVGKGETVAVTVGFTEQAVSEKMTRISKLSRTVDFRISTYRLSSS